MPIAVDVDLVRFEKNLLQIGFFGANDARDNSHTTRRIEQVVFRNGHKIKVAAEFRGSEALGLPSTTDRDKFIALLKIISENRAKTGKIDNPVRFSGYRLIQELGLSRNGEIYEEILRWGKRMTDTTITSEQVVYRAAKKVYSDETLHVFRSFRRTGSSNLNGNDRQEQYEVVLEDWLVENLNQRYVIPEDFNAYKQLARPTAKGIFGNLHLWFHASQGRQVEKDYAELCNLLNVQVYPHLSKIKSTMGLALNELVSIKYLSAWDVQSMSSKTGYKIVLQPGSELLRILETSKTDRRDPPQSTLESNKLSKAANQNRQAFTLLERYGVLHSKANQLVTKYKGEYILEVIHYLESQVFESKRRTIENPAGLIIYSIENDLTVPENFPNKPISSFLAETNEAPPLTEAESPDRELSYKQWKESVQQEAISQMFSDSELEIKLKEIVTRQCLSNEVFRRVPPKNRRALAMQILVKEVSSSLTLPSFEDWSLEIYTAPVD